MNNDHVHDMECMREFTVTSLTCEKSNTTNTRNTDDQIKVTSTPKANFIMPTPKANSITSTAKAQSVASSSNSTLSSSLRISLSILKAVQLHLRATKAIYHTKTY